jgi:hypothetical protein
MQKRDSDSFSDFSGFLDGYQARNMAAIERSAAVPVSELNTRLRVLRDAVESEMPGDAVAVLVRAAEDRMRDSSGTIVSRLVDVANLVQTILNMHFKHISNDKVKGDLKVIVRRFVDVAESSHNETLIKSAVQLAETFEGQVVR